MSQGSKLIYVPIYFPLQRCIEMGIIMVSILQIKKLRLKEFKTLPKVINGTPLQYSCLENPIDGGAW